MVNNKTDRLSREDWILGALELLTEAGVEGVKIVPLAERLGVTSGSFYWHFKNRRELHEALLDYWEYEMTDTPIKAARHFEGPAEERIWNLMQQVMKSGLARYDLAIWHWAQIDTTVQELFNRVIKKRFKFTKWIFSQAGFSKSQAESRGRMMAVYMMGESTLIPDTPGDRKEQLRLMYEILTSS